MHVEQCLLTFDAQELLEPTFQRIGWNDDGERRKRVVVDQREVDLVGGPLAFLSGVAVLFDLIEAGSAAQGAMTILGIAWEASLGIYLVWKGFRRDAPILAGDAAPVRV